MCDTCVEIANAVTPAPDFTPQSDGCEITVADDGNRDLVLSALDTYADLYLSQCEMLSGLATDPAQGIVIMRNAVNTTTRIVALVNSLSANVDNNTAASAGSEN